MNIDDEQAKDIWDPNISVKQTEKFYSLKSYSGYRLQFSDPEVEEISLEYNSSDVLLGQSVLKSIKQSRHLSYEQACIFKKILAERYQIWIQHMLTKYGYKNKRALFKNMKNCNITLNKDLLIIRPTKHEKLEGWSGDDFTEEDYVKIPANSPPEEIGAALRLAFTSCR